MPWARYFEPLGRGERIVAGLVLLALGVGGLALAAASFWPAGPLGHSPVGGALAGGTGLFALVLARRLLLNESPYPQGHLVRPWLGLVVGAVLLVFAVLQLVWLERQKPAEAIWMLIMGAAACRFWWQHRSDRAEDPSALAPRQDGV
jgi:uncharacterized membrane protein